MNTFNITSIGVDLYPEAEDMTIYFYVEGKKEPFFLSDLKNKTRKNFEEIADSVIKALLKKKKLLWKKEK